MIRPASYTFAALLSLLGSAGAHAQGFVVGGFGVSPQIGIYGSVQIGPPPPPVVYVQPAPPPVVYVQPAPAPPTVIYREAAPAQPAPPAPAPQPMGMGVHGRIGLMQGEHVDMAGLTGALRLRPANSALAVDLSIGAYGGTDYNGLDRGEVPMMADLLLYLNPRDTFQLFALAGAGLSIGHAEGTSRWTGLSEQRDYAHLGAELGGGLEWRLSPWFALQGDVRGFLRQRIDTHREPEFVEYDASGRPTGKSTDTSAGALWSVGATLYF